MATILEANICKIGTFNNNQVLVKTASCIKCLIITNCGSSPESQTYYAVCRVEKLQHNSWFRAFRQLENPGNCSGETA